MEFSLVGGGGEPFPTSAAAVLQQLLDLPDELERQLNPPTRAYVRDRRAMANTPMDVKELPSGALVLAVDMPGVSPADVRVQVEEGNVLTISGERKRPGDAGDGKAADAVKYLRMERRMGKFMRKFPLPESADLDSVRAEYKDGVLTVTVHKKPPPEPKKPRVVEVKAGDGEPKDK
ncbi:19.0 kDa class II heat shock protein-like [Oryza brachyantha]|uniref:SHSP domain-containing protein n=1 Tax=Oryza brachyantha TaxID=4533 RepID=J3LAX0_ORYBR|nr:19.0 kDa class II heat shock protein-like [Oryza brachyantha]